MAHLTLADAASRTTPMAKRKIKFIQKATANAHGQFRAKAERAGETTRQYAEEKKHASGKTGQQARLALTLMGMHHGKHKRSVLHDHPRSNRED